MMVEVDVFRMVTMVTDGTFFVTTRSPGITVDPVTGGGARSGGAWGAGTKATVDAAESVDVDAVNPIVDKIV
jgi:hypothetical protein